MSWAFLVDSVPFTKAVRDGETSLGGSESACLGLARALKRRGHDVHVFATRLAPDAGGVDASGVTWHPAESFPRANQWIEWDVVVALRQCHWFNVPVHARLRLLWNQDLLLPGGGAPIMSIAWALDHLVYVSDYHRRQWEDEEKTLEPLGWVTKNGYDPAHVPTSVTKVPDRIVHISRPERGLRPSLQMWPAIRKANPNADLRLCRYASMYDGEGSNVRAMCEEFDQAVTHLNFQVGGITWLGALNKAQLYKEIAEAAVMWYPGIAEFAETSCIAAVEAQACGTPFVGSYRGALPETVPSGTLIKGDAMSAAYQADSIAAVLSQMQQCRSNSFSYRSVVKHGREHVKAYTYDVIAAEWEAQVERWFAERYASNKRRIMQQLLHDDDHVAARVVAEDILQPEYRPNAVAEIFEGAAPSSDCNEASAARAFCDRVIAGLEQGADDYAAHAIQDPLHEVQLSSRLAIIAPHFKNCTRILDVACGNGAGAIAIALENPGVRVHGVDYAAHNIEIATDAAQRAGVGDRCTFEHLTFWDLPAGRPADGVTLTSPFDGAFIGEFAEHVADCAALVDFVETFLADGATVVYTCPMGPFGELVPRGQPIQRGHVHSFKHDDVKAVWGTKADCGADFMEIGVTPRGIPIGHWIIHYTTAPNRPAGDRDLRTRAMRTRPLQRLSVGLITKDAEQDLARCLNSIYAIADEILVGDTGSTDDTVGIAEKFGARVLPLDPIEVQPQGFAGARNAVLAQATGDWFLWIDADETLLEAPWLRRYLDGTLYHGFVLHQTHLYMDGPPTYDIPVRLFRVGQGIQFYGAVHEQPQMVDENTDIFPTLEPYDVRLAHTGYLTNAVREAKRAQRNLPLITRDQAMFPNRVLGKLILLRETALQADTERAANQGQLTPRAAAGFTHVLTLYDTYFADPSHRHHKLARPWYEAALKGLGLGFEMLIAVGGKPLHLGGLGTSRPKPDRVVVRDYAEYARLLAFKNRSIESDMTGRTMKTDPNVGLPASVDELVEASV